MTTRSRRHGGGHQDPTASRARIGGAGQVLRSLPDDHARVLLASLAYFLTDREIAEYFGLPRERVYPLFREAFEMIRHPSRSQAVDWHAELAEGGSCPLRSGH